MNNKIEVNIIKELRDKTGVGIMDCKRAILESDGDINISIELLRKWGLKDQEKRQEKMTSEGVIGTYIHHGNQVVAIVELNCETDFVARGAEFIELANKIALHVAAMNPTYISKNDVPEEIINKEVEILTETLSEKQKLMASKIIPGKIQKFYEYNCLMNQPFVRDNTLTISDLIFDLRAKVGEKIVIKRFVRYKVGT